MPFRWSSGGHPPIPPQVTPPQHSARFEQRYNGSTKCQNQDTQMLSEIRKPKKKMRMKVGPRQRCGRMTATRWLRVPLMRWMKSRKKTSHGKSLDAAKRFTVAKSKIPHPWRDGGLTLSLRLSVSRMYCRLRVSAVIEFKSDQVQILNRKANVLYS